MTLRYQGLAKVCKLGLFALTLTSTLTLKSAIAGPCVSDTLTNYIALGEPGCTVGNFSYFNFFFNVPAQSGGPSLLTSNDILVTPSLFPNGNVTLAFAGAFFVGSGQAVTYAINYTSDPPPPIEGGMGLSFFDDGGGEQFFSALSVGDGSITITQSVCLDDFFASPTTCLPGAQTPTPLSHQVFQNQSSSLFSSLVDFPDAFLVDIYTLIDLNGGTFGGASFTSLEETTINAPEPGTALIAAAGLGLLALRRRLRRIP